MKLNRDKELYEQHIPDDEGEVGAGSLLQSKWFWKMEFCKKHGLAPANNSVWEYVEKKWLEAQTEESGSTK